MNPKLDKNIKSDKQSSINLSDYDKYKSATRTIGGPDLAKKPTNRFRLYYSYTSND